MSNGKKKVAIIGAGPAGLTAAYELLNKSTDYKVEIYEATSYIGGISKTMNYKGNRIDLGGHRFFSKSDKVMTWWEKLFPIYEHKEPSLDRISNEYFHNNSKMSSNAEKIFLTRQRISRLFFEGKFYDYPISLHPKTFIKLGFLRSIKIVLTYVWVKVFPREETSLADFYINRFGHELYNTFFNSYTERLWGTKPENISPEWGLQRVKGISLKKVVIDSIKRILRARNANISQKEVETSLISKFLYPKYGPGQFWEHVASEIEKGGGNIHINRRVTGLQIKNNKVIKAVIKNEKTQITKEVLADYVISTAPIKDLVKGISPPPPKKVYNIASNLEYRDFLTVGLLFKKLTIQNDTNVKTLNKMIPDNWIYIHQKGANVLRIQFFNNWSPYMVNDKNYVWLGMEFTMDENSDFWDMSDRKLKDMAMRELVSLSMVKEEDIIDHIVIKTPKAYPAYFGSYKDFSHVRKYLDSIENLYLIGRNGMHRYNNMDHSMLSAFEAVSNIIKGKKTKENIWNVNTEEEYHETCK